MWGVGHGTRGGAGGSRGARHTKGRLGTHCGLGWSVRCGDAGRARRREAAGAAARLGRRGHAVDAGPHRLAAQGGVYVAAAPGRQTGGGGLAAVARRDGVAMAEDAMQTNRARHTTRSRHVTAHHRTTHTNSLPVGTNAYRLPAGGTGGAASDGEA